MRNEITFTAQPRKAQKDSFFIVGSTPTQTAIAVGILSPFPGSEQLMVSHDLWVYPAARGNGYSLSYNDFIVQHCKSLGKRAILASIKPDNIVQQHRLPKLEWEQLTKTIWIKKLYPAKTKPGQAVPVATGLSQKTGAIPIADLRGGFWSGSLLDSGE